MEQMKKLLNSLKTSSEHMVEWKGVRSEPIDLYNYSCVQGSTIGAPIFNHYTRDMLNITDDSDIIMFADDTNFVISSKNERTAIQKANEILQKTERYLNANKLIMNKDKTSYMMFKPDGKKENNCNDKIKLEGKEIQRVKNARFLGIYIDDKLKFDEQFKRLKDKLKEGLKALICCRKIMNFKAKMLLYNGLIKSHLEYCTISYMDKFNKRQMNEIQKIQKQAIRLIFGVRMKAHTSNLFKMAKIIPIKNYMKWKH